MILLIAGANKGGGNSETKSFSVGVVPTTIGVSSSSGKDKVIDEFIFFLFK